MPEENEVEIIEAPVEEPGPIVEVAVEEGDIHQINVDRDI